MVRNHLGEPGTALHFSRLVDHISLFPRHATQLLFRREFSVRASLRATAVARVTQRKLAPNDEPSKLGYAHPRGAKWHDSAGTSHHRPSFAQTRGARQQCK